MIKEFPFGRFGGFGSGHRMFGRYPIEYYYSYGMRRGTFPGVETGMSITSQLDSGTAALLGKIQWYAFQNYLFAQDDSGQIWQGVNTATTVLGTSPVRSPGGTGNGLLADQKGNLLYAQATQIGKYDGTTWTDNWQTGLNSGLHPMDTYEDSVVVGNVTSLGIVANDGTWNPTAFTLPSNLSIVGVKSGAKGVLIGANMGASGVLILWDLLKTRSLAPWIWTGSPVQAILTVEGGWIVVTGKEVLLTNGYSKKTLFTFFDDPTSLNSFNVGPQGLALLGTKVHLLQEGGNYARMKPGILVFDLATGTTQGQLFEFIPLPTHNLVSAQPTAMLQMKQAGLRPVVAFNDGALSKNYNGILTEKGS